MILHLGSFSYLMISPQRAIRILSNFWGFSLKYISNHIEGKYLKTCEFYTKITKIPLLTKLNSKDTSTKGLLWYDLWALHQEFFKYLKIYRFYTKKLKNIIKLAPTKLISQGNLRESIFNWITDSKEAS